MTDYANGIVLEARKKGLSQVSTKDGDFYRVSFDIHPDDASSELSKMKLGTRVCLVVTAMAADGDDKPAQTAPEATRVKGGPRAKMTGILRNDESFTRWLCRNYNGYWNEALRSDNGDTPHVAAATIHLLCGVKSCAELDHNDLAGRIWDGIESGYRAADRGVTPEALAVQARTR